MVFERTLDELYALIRREIEKHTIGALDEFLPTPERYHGVGLDALFVVDLESEELNEHFIDTLLTSHRDKFLNPSPSQIKAIVYALGVINHRKNYVKDDPFGRPLEWAPRAGAFFYGPPGTGKTHILAVMHQELTSRAQQEIQDFEHFTQRKIVEFVQELIEGYEAGRYTVESNPSLHDASAPYDLGSQSTDPVCSVEQAIQNFIKFFVNEMWPTVQIKPTDFIFIGFDRLAEIKDTNPELYQRILESRYLFIDEVSNLDTTRVEVFLDVLQHRYEKRLFGTFMTSNFTPEELVNEPKTRDRILSRISEFMITFDFTDATDFRTHMLRHVTVGMVERQIAQDCKDFSGKSATISELLQKTACRPL